MKIKDRIEFKKITLTDVINISLLEYSIWRDTYKDILPKDYLENLNVCHIKEKFIKRLKNKNIDTYLIIMNGINIGYFVLTYYTNKMELSKIYILRDYQHIGIGTYSMFYIQNKAVERKLYIIEAWIIEHNTDSERFHQKLGFSPTFDEKILPSFIDIRAFKYIKFLTNTDNQIK